MFELKQTETFRKWRTKLGDERARALIAYRVYFQKRGTALIVLLCGGDKNTQAKDIKTAKRLAHEWSE